VKNLHLQVTLLSAKRCGSGAACGYSAPLKWLCLDLTKKWEFRIAIDMITIRIKLSTLQLMST